MNRWSPSRDRPAPPTHSHQTQVTASSQSDNSSVKSLTNAMSADIACIGGAADDVTQRDDISTVSLLDQLSISSSSSRDETHRSGPIITLIE